MPIADLDSLFQADGVFALGVKVRVQSKSNPGEMVDAPKKENHFVIRPGTFPDKALLKAVIDKYGEQPHTLLVTFLSDVPDEIFPYYWMRWSGPGVLACKGTGRKIVEEPKPGQEPRPCLGRDCEYAKKEKCKRECTVYFALHEVDVTKKFRTGSKGIHSIKKLRAVIEKEYGYQVKGKEFILRLVPMVRKGRFFSLEIEPTGKMVDLGAAPAVDNEETLKQKCRELVKKLDLPDHEVDALWEGTVVNRNRKELLRQLEIRMNKAKEEKADENA